MQSPSCSVGEGAAGSVVQCRQQEGLQCRSRTVGGVILSSAVGGVGHCSAVWEVARVELYSAVEDSYSRRGLYIVT